MRMERDDEEQASYLERLLGGFVEHVYRRPVIALACALIVAGVSMYFSSTRLQFFTQRSDLVSPKKDYVKRWQKYLAEFGDDEDMVLVVQGSRREEMERALEEIAGEIARHPQLFDRLFFKCDLRHLRNRALLYLPANQIAQIQGNLENMKLLLEAPSIGGIDGWKILSLGSMLEEASHRVPAIERDGLRPGDDSFLTQLNSISLAAAKVIDDPAGYANPWQSILPPSPEQKDLLAEPQYFFSGDGTLAFLLVRPVKEADSFTAAKQSVQKLREIVDAARPRFKELEFGCTGLPVLETDEMVASQEDTGTASWLALAGIWLLYLVVYRGIRYPVMTVSTLLIGTAWAMGWLTLTVGHLNIVSATFAVMLIGMGDYAVLWVTRYEQERNGGLDILAAVRIAAQKIGPSTLTAGLTTALAFYAAMLADFQAVAELGWIAGSGVLLCAVACFVVMPAALRLFDRRTRPLRIAVPTETGLAWLPTLASRPRWVLGAGVLATVVCGIFALRIDYDHNLLHLQADNLASVKWEQTLIEHTAGASWHALSYTATPEEALALKARYEQEPGISRVVEVASLVPPGQSAKIEQLRDIQKRLRKLPERGAIIPHAQPKAEEIQARAERVLTQLQPLLTSGAHPLLVQLGANVKVLHDKLAGADITVVAPRLQHFDDLLTRDLVDDLHKLLDVSTPAEIALSELPASLRERYVGKTGAWLLQVFAKESLWEYDALARFVEQIHKVDPEATGKPFATLEGLRSMKEGFEWAGLYALLAIVAVFYVDFRSLRYTLIALAPLAMGVIVSLGIMSLVGFALNPANMIAFPLILGVGADNGIHVLNDYLRDRGRGPYTLRRTMGQGICVKALTTIIGFGTLMISQHRGLASLGFILTLGVGCCMLTALVCLPAVLRLWSLRLVDTPAPHDGNLPLRTEHAAAA
jgi:hopanoid biosynthesis associated RND transporter like protein HpnN